MSKPCKKCGASDRNNSGDCRPCSKARSLKWQRANPERSAAKHRKWLADNPDYSRKLRQQNHNYRIAGDLRARLSVAVSGSFKAGSAVDDLGCTMQELKIHLENLWQPGMTWENRTKNGWHIDHIIPLAKFDLSNREQILKACHYTNLQPLWAKDNLSKGAK